MGVNVWMCHISSAHDSGSISTSIHNCFLFVEIDMEATREWNEKIALVAMNEKKKRPAYVFGLCDGCYSHDHINNIIY